MKTKKFILLIVSAILLATMVFGTQNVSRANNLNFIYLPLISRPMIAELISPINGVALNTLLPVFTFKTEPFGENGYAVLDYDTAPTFDTINGHSWSLWRDPDEAGVHTLVPIENLLPNTTYYWRVGIVRDRINRVEEWGPTGTFITGGNGVFPAAPVLTAPAPNAVLNQEVDTTFSWQPVAGATGYALWICDENDNCSIYSTDQTSELVWLYWDNPGTYTWYVLARNEYGFGPASEVRPYTLNGTVFHLEADSVSAPQQSGEMIQSDGETIKLYR